eukprot:7255545-Pyramimonas_sp.AAC.1
MREIRFAPLFLELRIRRIKWLQKLVEMKEDNSQLLSAVFGPTKFDGPVFVDGRVPERANPRARQAQQDLDALTAT